MIEKLLNNKPFIDNKNCVIISKNNLYNLLNKTDEIKCEYVNFINYISEQYGGNSKINNIKVGEYGNFFISKKLLNFFIYNSEIYQLKEFFGLFNINKHQEVYQKLIDNFNYLREDPSGYLSYGNKSEKIRYGRFISTFLKYLDKDASYLSYKQKEIEKSVDLYKNEFSLSEYSVCILNGEDIKIGYNTNYHLIVFGSMLYNSCMNDSLSFLKIYSKNIKKINLFVVLDNNGKIVSRALLWKLKNTYLMDRIYSINNNIRKIVEDVTFKNNWLLRDESGNIKSDNKNINYNKRINIRLKLKGIEKYPYIDTFYRQFLFTRIFTNKIGFLTKSRYQNTNGHRG